MNILITQDIDFLSYIESCSFSLTIIHYNINLFDYGMIAQLARLVCFM